MLRGCPVDDEAVAPLRGMPSLRVLDVRDCEGLSDDAVRTLAASMPACRIER